MPEERTSLVIAYPPPFVFKYPRNVHAPSQEVITENVGFNFEKVKYPSLKDKPEEFFNQYHNIGENRPLKKTDFDFNFKEGEEKMGGQLVYFTGVNHPAKGHPFPQALYAVGAAKSLTREMLDFLSHKDLKWVLLGFFITSQKNKRSIISRFCQKYALVSGKSIVPYILNEEFMTPCAKEILFFCQRFLKKLGINEYAYNGLSFSETFANEIEYDNVYRLRIEDGMSETTKEKMIENPRRELLKIAKILTERDPNWQTSIKFRQAIKIISYFLVIPKYKRIFRECVKESRFEYFQYDDADREHVLLIMDYNFMGFTPEERFNKFQDIYKDNPPRRLIYGR